LGQPNKSLLGYLGPSGGGGGGGGSERHEKQKAGEREEFNTLAKKSPSFELGGTFCVGGSWPREGNEKVGLHDRVQAKNLGFGTKERVGRHPPG